jgi:DNA-binding GntR family transcriptional regulator
MSEPNIEPIRRSTLSSMVTERLRELVIQGSYAPGTQLSEVELAERFGVSRGPIREGLQRLVQEGLLRSEPHRGVFIPVISDDDVLDIYLAREAIEGAAAKAIVARPDRREVTETLKRLVRDMEKAAAAQRWGDVADLDMRFHLEIVRGAGSRRLSRMFGTLIDETRALLRLTAADAGREERVMEHGEIARTLEAGDVDGALTSLGRHFEESQRSMRGNGSGDEAVETKHAASSGDDSTSAGD